MQDNTQKNPSEYGYRPDQKIEIQGQVLENIFSFMEQVLEMETKVYYPEKYMYVDKETSKEIKKVTAKNKDKAIKVVDPKGTLTAKPTIYRTQTGIAMLRFKNYMAELHYKNVEDGVAIHKDELLKQGRENVETVAE